MHICIIITLNVSVMFMYRALSSIVVALICVHRCVIRVHRSSSAPLLAALRDGVSALNAQFTDFGKFRFFLSAMYLYLASDL